MKIHIMKSTAAKKMGDKLAKFCQSVDNVESASHVLVVGGDGTMLHAIRSLRSRNILNKKIYGLNAGTVGFLLNTMPNEINNLLLEKIERAHEIPLKCLEMEAINTDGYKIQGFAFNEVSIIRRGAQALKLGICVDGRERISQMVGDGIMIATPQGSTAYNFASSGPILPLHCNLLAMTPVSVFRPRRWSGALIPNNSVVNIKIQELAKRPAVVATDALAFTQISEITIREEALPSVSLLFDDGDELRERIFNEQFMFS